MSTETEGTAQEMDSNLSPEATAEPSNEQSGESQQMDSEEDTVDTVQPGDDPPVTVIVTKPDETTESENVPDQQQSSAPQADQPDQEKEEPIGDTDEQSGSKTPQEVASTEKEPGSQAASTSRTVPDSPPEQVGESAVGKEEPKDLEASQETAQAESTKQTGPTDHDTESSGGNQPQEPETEQLEVTSSAGEATEDQKDQADVDLKQPETSRPGTDQSTTKKKDKDKKDKKKDKKREKKRSRQTSRDEGPSTSADPTTRGEANHLEAILLSYFKTVDVENNGLVASKAFWEIIQSAELNLQLSAEELARLQGLVEQDDSGMISYTEFSSHAVRLISSVYKEQPASDHHWVLITSKDKSLNASYNKQTGESRETVAEEVNLFGEYIESLFQGADTGSKGYVTTEEFANLLQSEQMSAYLSDEDVLQMQQYFENIPEGKATFTDFYPLGHELILKVYRARDASESEWLQLNSAQGVVWLNKYTGETRRNAADDKQQAIDFITQTIAEVDAVKFELQQYKQQNKDLQNELALAAEEQETLATQLYETGHHLDEANAEIEARSRELDEAREIINSKEREIDQFLAQREEFEALRQTLEDTKDELKMARNTIAVRDRTVAKRDTNISELQRTSDAVTDKLKTAHGQVDARDSTISNLKHKVNFQQNEAQKYEKQVIELEEKLSSTEQELRVTKQTLEEKTSALLQARKHLKNSRERTMDLEKDSEKLTQTQEKLRSAECEIRTLKSFLTTKTAMIEKNKKELRETKGKLAELQEKDRRRAIILADVLEKTARQFQQRMETSPTRQMQLDPLQTPVEARPASAPAIPPEGDETDGPEEPQSPRLRVMKSYTVSKEATASPFFGAGKQSPPQKRTVKTKPRGRSKTVPKLPPIPKVGQAQKHTSFVFPTQNDIRRQHWEKDQAVLEHADSNPHCTCEMCRMNSSVVGPSTLRPETGVTAQTGLSGFQVDIDPKEMAMARQLRKGQRVVIRMKKSEYDLEPQQLTGIVKYIGKVDSEYIDNRIYVGVKLDEAAGDTDGLIKGKRYFTCPAKHGKIVRISSVVAVLPNKSVFYKPLQGIKKRSPYGGTATPKKSSTDSIRVA